MLGLSKTKMLIKHDYFKGALGLITNKGDCKMFYLEKKTFISQYGLYMTWHSPTQWHTCCLPSAWCSVNQDSSVKRTLLQSARCHRRCAFAHSNRSWQGTAIGEDNKLAEEFVHKFFVQTNYFISCPGGRSQTNMEVKKPDLEVLGWHSYMWSAVVRTVWCTVKFSDT